ncbi:hypothetical protein SNEBB_006105 [Seison nebaliae]|nr:hypothetical protein SNEBB_006105 [Seison nebaliae]
MINQVKTKLSMIKFNDLVVWEILLILIKLTYGKNAPIESECEILLNDYSNQSAKLFECLNKNSVPLRYCEECGKEYLLSSNSYKQLVNNSHKDQFGRYCRNVIIRSNAIQMPYKTHHLLQNIWMESACNNCYDNLELTNDNQINMKITNRTTKYFDLLNNYQHCLYNYSTLTNVTVCEFCANAYKNLNNYYEELNPITSSICFDIRDAMNYTRLRWSKELKCTEVDIDTASIYISLVIAILLPLLFYGMMNKFSRRKFNIIVKENRIRHNQNDDNGDDDDKNLLLFHNPENTTIGDSTNEEDQQIN